MNNSSVIFIGSPSKTGKKNYLLVPPYDLLCRVFISFVPPVSKKFNKVYVDYLGPILGYLLLIAILNYGVAFKVKPVSSPTIAVLIYAAVMPVLCYILCKIGLSSVDFSEVISLLGYAVYGHVFTILVSFLLFQERNNFFFFLCLIFFGGLSTLRIILIFLATIPKPVFRLLVCSVISVINLLYLVFLHFNYMHPTFVHKL